MVAEKIPVEPFPPGPYLHWENSLLCVNNMCRFRDGNFIQWTYLLLERKAKCFFSSRHLRRSWIKMDSDCSDVSSVAIGPMAMGAGAPWNTHSTGIFQRLHLARRKALVSLEIPEQCHVWSGPKLKMGWMWYGHPSHNGNSYSGCIYDEICIYTCMYVCMHVMNVCMYVCMHVCMYVCVYMYLYIYTCIYIHSISVYQYIRISVLMIIYWGSKEYRAHSDKDDEAINLACFSGSKGIMAGMPVSSEWPRFSIG